MAAPITHIVLSNKVFDQFFKSKDRAAFFVGTSFPDIRYLGIISRNKTHYQKMNLSDVVNEESFMSGVKFHSLVDIVREDFYQRNNLYSLIPDSVYKTQTVKVYEDILLHGKVSDWETISNYFDQVYSEEVGYGLKLSEIQSWHQLLIPYFQNEPTIDNMQNFSKGISNGKKEMPEEITKTIEIIKKIPELKDKIYEMYSNFSDLLKI